MEVAADYDCCGVAICRRIDEYQKETGEDINKIYDRNISPKSKINRETEEVKC